MAIPATGATPRHLCDPIHAGASSLNQAEGTQGTISTDRDRHAAALELLGALGLERGALNLLRRFSRASLELFDAKWAIAWRRDSSEGMARICVAGKDAAEPAPPPGTGPATESVEETMADGVVRLSESELLIPFGKSGYLVSLSQSGGERRFNAEDKRFAEILSPCVDHLLAQCLRTSEAVAEATQLRRQVEQLHLDVSELRENEELFRSAFEDTNVAMVLTSLDHRFIRANTAFVRMFGYTPEETLQLTMPDITHPDHLQESFARRHVLLEGGGDYFQMEKCYARKDGTALWGLTNVSLLRDRQTGEPLLYIGQLQDITERKRAEAQFREAQERLRHVVGSSPAVLFSLAVEEGSLRPTWISDNVREVLGHDPEAPLQDGWWEKHVHPEDLLRSRAELDSELFRNGRLTHEFRLRTPEGQYRWVRSEMRLLHDAEGRPTEVMGSWSDVTEKKRLEDQFRQAQKMEAIGQFAGGIAHDFNNMLAIITGYSDLIQMRDDLDSSVREQIEAMSEASDRAAALTRQLLAFSRKQILSPQNLDLALTVKNLGKMLQRLIGEDIELEVVPANSPAPIVADPGQIEQVVINLAANARDAMESGGKLTIEVRAVDVDETRSRQLGNLPEGPYFLLAVSDTGCGMDLETASRIFDPFFTTKEVGKGTGLGLATVHGIVNQSGGHISVYSEPGNGTTFKIYLPRAKSGSTDASVSEHGPLPRGQETILLLEDDERVRAVANAILTSLGYKVVEARDPEEALALAADAGLAFDLLLSDVVMPRLSGREVAEKVRELRPGTKVLFMSGYTDDAIIRHGVLSATMAFIEKPFSARGLATKVREVLNTA